MTTGIKVGEIMRKAVITVKKDDTITKVIDIMTQADIGGVVVIENKAVVGMLTEGDIIKKILGKKKDYHNLTVGEIMSHPVRVISDDADLEDVAKIMRDLRIERIPIVKNNELQGLVTERDLTLMEPALLELMQIKGDLGSLPGTMPEGLVTGTCESCGNFSQELTQVNGKFLCKECR